MTLPPAAPSLLHHRRSLTPLLARGALGGDGKPATLGPIHPHHGRQAPTSTSSSTMQTARALSARAAPVTLATGCSRPVRCVKVQATFEQERGGRPRGRGRFDRRPKEDLPEFKHFLPLPKPEHLIFIKPTVAVVAGTASRNSVGLKMTVGDNQLERFVVEYYSKNL